MQRAASTTEPPDSDDAAAILCPRCGYDLRARTASRCPECGLLIPGFERPLVPWIQPAGRTPAGALVATACLVLRRPQAVAAAVAYPLRDRDTRGFQLALVLWAWGWTLLTAAVVGRLEPGLLDLISAGFGWPIWLAEAIGWLLVLWLATSAVTLVFDAPHKAEFGRRCQAVACFTAAPLLLAPLPLGVMAVSAVGMVRVKAPAASLACVVAFLLGLGLALGLPALILQCVVALGRHLRHDPARLTAAVVALPAVWLLLAVLLLGGLAGLAFFVGVVIGSLT